MKNKNICFIGGGNMAEAIIKGMLSSNLISPKKIFVFDISIDRLKYLSEKYGIQIFSDLSNICNQMIDYLFLAIKPQNISKTYDLINKNINTSTVIISIVAGVKIATLKNNLKKFKIIRCMPNNPLAIGEGMTAICKGNLDENKYLDDVKKIFSSSGNVIVIDENDIDAFTALAGSGPGYIYVLLDAFADAGVLVGLSRDAAIKVAAQTFLGSAKMLLETGYHPSILRDMVTSPAGTTIKGIYKMEQKAVRAALIDAIVAARDCSIEMGKNNVDS